MFYFIRSRECQMHSIPRWAVAWGQEARKAPLRVHNMQLCHYENVKAKRPTLSSTDADEVNVHVHASAYGVLQGFSCLWVLVIELILNFLHLTVYNQWSSYGRGSTQHKPFLFEYRPIQLGLLHLLNRCWFTFLHHRQKMHSPICASVDLGLWWSIEFPFI